MDWKNKFTLFVKYKTLVVLKIRYYRNLRTFCFYTTSHKYAFTLIFSINIDQYLQWWGSSDTTLTHTLIHKLFFLLEMFIKTVSVTIINDIVFVLDKRLRMFFNVIQVPFLVSYLHIYRIKRRFSDVNYPTNLILGLLFITICNCKEQSDHE